MGKLKAAHHSALPDPAALEGARKQKLPLANRRKSQLYDQAQELSIAGRSKMDKSELVEAIGEHS